MTQPFASNSAMNLYEAHNLSRRYDQSGHPVPALRGLSLGISQGEFVAIAGPSGSGKTTLLNLLGLLDSPNEGSLRFEDQDTADLNEHQRTWIRRKRIGFIFQSLRRFISMAKQHKACKACQHEKRTEIDRVLVSGEAPRQVASRYGLSATGLQRHQKHIAPSLVKAREAVEIGQASTF